MVSIAKSGLRHWFITCAAMWIACCWPDSMAHAKPERVVSINLCTDELALLMAEDEYLLSVTDLVADPELSIFADRIAGKHINRGRAEEILMLAPDLVLAGTVTTPYAKSLLRRFDIPLVEIPHATRIEDIEKAVSAVGEALGEQEKANRILEDLDRDLASLASTVEEHKDDLSSPTAVVLEGSGYSQGQNSLLHELLELSGWRNIAHDLGMTPWAMLPLEALLKGNPDAIVLSTFGSERNTMRMMFLNHPSFQRFAAERHVLHIEPNLWTCGTPSIVEALRLLVSAHHGIQR